MKLEAECSTASVRNPRNRGSNHRTPDEGAGSPNDHRCRVSVFGAGAPPRRVCGFTLIEVLAAMAVLVILVLALTRMFVEATNIAKRGNSMLMRNSTMETAMETLLQDAESMMVNERLACSVRADQTDKDGFGFDEVYFIGTSGDQDDDMPYEYFHYFVSDRVSTNATGAAYRRFRLIKERMVFAVGDQNSLYALDPKDVRWWEIANNLDRWDTQVLADNVVRFDVYCTGWDGGGLMGGKSGIHQFDSTEAHLIDGQSYSNVPPAAFDIYLEVTGPEVAEESGMALVTGVDDATQDKARAMMRRGASSLFGRAVPVNGAAQYNRTAVFGATNTSYYLD